MSRSVALETHEHCYITGPNSRFAGSARGRLTHSHDGGDKPHVHEDAAQRTGCGSYTIDKDEWFKRTGLRGGGHKKFTRKQTGVQMPLIAIGAPQIRVVIVGDGGAAVARGASGAGESPVVRMQLACKSQVISVTHAPLSRTRLAK